MKVHWKTACIAALIPTLFFSALLVYAYQSFTNMGAMQIRQKTENYTKLSEAAPHQATVFFGDSITELCPLEDLYAEYTKKTGVPVLNRGISAEKTDTMLKRLESTVLNTEPRNLIMVMGINDFFAGVSNVKINENIDKMIEITKSKSPHTNIILSSVYPINTADRNSLLEKMQMLGKDTDAIDELNAMLKQTAKKHHVTYLDMDAVLKDAQGNLKHAYAYDGLHPNTKGYLAIRPLILQVVK